MKRKVFALALIAILAGISLSACTRSATKSPETTEIPFPAGTSDPSTRLTEIIQQTNAVLPTVEGTSATSGQDTTTQATAIVSIPTATNTPAPTATLPAIPTLTRPETYTLQKGEWPICIARRYDLDVSTLLSANGLNMNSSPAEGSVLKIPASGTWNSGERELKAHPTDYTVVSGDTIYKVACAYGDVSPEGIAAANGLAAPYSLTAGQVLRIP